MELTCFQQVLLDQVLADYNREIPEEPLSPRPQQAGAIFRRARRHWHPVSAGVRAAGWASILLIPALVLGLWILRDRHQPPPVTEPTDRTTAPTEPAPTEPETITVHLLTVARSYESDGTLSSIATYTYDHRGLPLTYHLDYTDDADTDLSYNYTYDDHGHLLDSLHGGHTYDEDGRLIRGTADGRRYQMIYDQDGRLERVQMVTVKEQLEDALVCEYEDDRLCYVFDLRHSTGPEICSFLYDDDGLPMYHPRWSRTLPKGYGDTVLTREWPDIGEYELTYTDGVLSHIRHLTESPELEDTFRLDGAGNTTRITKASGAYTEYEFRSLTLDADWALRLPRRDFRNEEAPIECYPDQILRLIFP